MIVDTTYLLPLARVDIDTDLLAAIVKRRIPTKIEDIAVSLISIFELQAKAAKLGVPAKYVARAAETIAAAFRVEPFHTAPLIETSFAVRKLIPDYIDAVIIATAINGKEDLVTEDSLILARRDAIMSRYGTRIISFKGLVRETRLPRGS